MITKLKLRNKARVFINKPYFYIMKHNNKFFYFYSLYSINDILRQSLRFFELNKLKHPLEKQFKAYLHKDYLKICKRTEKTRQIKLKRTIQARENKQKIINVINQDILKYGVKLYLGEDYTLKAKWII